jgi:predicted dehydrogenase
MATKRLGIGVIGAGRWANLAHLPGWARDDRCQIVGICDLDADRAAAAAASFGAEVATTDYRELLKRDDVDIIDVITRDSEHFALNSAALDAGKHVLSEKPVAHDHRDVAGLAARARSAGLNRRIAPEAPELILNVIGRD